MEDTESGKEDVLLWHEGYCVEGFIVTDVGELATRIVNMQEALPALWSFTSALKTEQMLYLRVIIKDPADLSIAKSLIKAKLISFVEESKRVFGKADKQTNIFGKRLQLIISRALNIESETLLFRGHYSDGQVDLSSNIFFGCVYFNLTVFKLSLLRRRVGKSRAHFL